MKYLVPTLIVIGVVGAGIVVWTQMDVGNDQKIRLSENDTADNPPPINLEPQTVTFGDGSEATFGLASPFAIAIAAEDLGKARFITMSPDGRLFIPDMVNFNYNTEGRIIILDDFNPETYRFESKDIYLTGLKNPNSVAFYEDSDGNSWIYIALTDRLIRYPYRTGDLSPSGNAEVITRFPDYRTVGGDVWHITRTISVHDDMLYVSVGSSCNICEEPEDEVRAMIVTMDPDGSNVRTYAEGLRNAVGLAWVDDTLYATVNGADHLGADAPDDVLYRIVQGEHYGFPYCYESGGESREETEWQWQREPIPCESIPLSFAVFGPHTAPLGLTYFENAHPLLERTFLAALHGSFRVEIGNGYEIARVDTDGNIEIFLTGFLGEEGERSGRPVHILQNGMNSFFFTDDFNGRLYYVYAGG
jgi:glucose/arabinose dehydrogenase